MCIIEDIHILSIVFVYIIGFHEACFDECHEPWCPGGVETQVFDGCQWVHAFYYDTIAWWLIPGEK